MSGYDPEDLASVWRVMRRLSRTRQPKDFPVGVDGMRAEKFEERIDQNIREIARRIARTDDDGLPSYNFASLLCFDRVKGSGGQRKIYIPRLRDQLVLRAMHEELVRAARAQNLRLTPPEPLHFVRSFRASLAKFEDPWVLRTDILSFYNSIPRKRVIEDAAALGVSDITRGLLRKWSTTLRARPSGSPVAPADLAVVGVPPGLSLSSSLAELWATSIDRAVSTQFTYFRFVDDIAVICASQAEAESALVCLESVVEHLGLALSPTKTAISPLANGVSWLGLVHFKDKFFADDNRLERWLRRFTSIRHKASKRLRTASGEIEKQEVMRDFHRELRDEISGRTSSRPAWYTMADDVGNWRIMDRMLHGMIRSIHRQAGFLPPTGRLLPSIHRSILARKSRESISAPSTAELGPCAISSREEDPTPAKGT